MLIFFYKICFAYKQFKKKCEIFVKYLVKYLIKSFTIDRLSWKQLKQVPTVNNSTFIFQTSYIQQQTHESLVFTKINTIGNSEFESLIFLMLEKKNQQRLLSVTWALLHVTLDTLYLSKLISLYWNALCNMARHMYI